MVSPFDFLPYELVSKIFRKAVIGHVYNGHFSCRKSDTYTLSSLYRVCAKWREICLRDGKLWASAIKMDCSDTAWVQTLVRRAKNVPWVILYDDEAYNQQPFTTLNWEYAFAHVTNWGEFFLQTPITWENSAPLVRALVQPAPSLESFQINNLYRPSEEDFMNDSLDHTFVLPDNLFAGYAPRLKKFAATEANLSSSFGFSIWEKLTDLQLIQAQEGLPDTQITSKQWLEILREIKQLEVLVLGWVFGSGLDDWRLHTIGFPPDPELEPNHSLANVADVHLDRLSVLTLTATVERNIMFDIFSKLTVPNACVTLIKIAHYFREEELLFNRLTLGLDKYIMRWCAADIPVYIGPFKLEKEFGFQIWGSHRKFYRFRFECVGDRLETWDTNPQAKAASPFYKMWNILESREAMVTRLFPC